MNCPTADTLIQHSLDVPLSSPERARLDAHLASCASCRRAWEDYRRLSQMSVSWARRPGPVETPPEEFAAHVMSRLAASPSPSAQFAWVPLLAGCLALLLLAILSPLAAPLLPTLGGWHVTWSPPNLPSVHLWLGTLSEDFAGLWASASDGVVSVRWAVLLLAAALPVNAWLCLRVRRDARRAA